MPKMISPYEVRKIQQAHMEAAKNKVFKFLMKGYKEKDYDDFVAEVFKSNEFELYIGGKKMKAAEKKRRTSKTPSQSPAENLEPNPNPAGNLHQGTPS